MTTSTLPPDHDARLTRARLALDGLSVGDALGQTCFRHHNWERLQLDPPEFDAGIWPYTDDTEMALAIYEVLVRHGRIEQNDLAATFARRFQKLPLRGYGAGAVRLLGLISAGADWKAAAETLFGGGSFGNGSAMRIAPLAAYFADDGFDVVAKQAALSAEVTHAHAEGIAGGIAAAVAGAYAWRHRERAGDPSVKRALFDAVLDHTPAGEVRDGIERAARFAFVLPQEPDVRLVDYGTTTVPFDGTVEPLVRELGNGSRITCQDTVPFCLWMAARHLNDYRAAVLNTIRVGGDIDTNAAIVGGIVALACGADGIPADWLDSRESLQLRS